MYKIRETIRIICSIFQMPGKKDNEVKGEELQNVSDKSGSEEEEEYSVEKIIEKRVVKGKTEYYLKWKGYPDSENTWEPVGNLDCPELIEEFEANLKKKEKAAASTPSSSSKPKSSGSKKKRSTAGPSSSKDTLKKEDEDEDAPPPKQKKVKKEETKKDDGPRGFERKLEPEKIIGATDSSGELMFLIKWKGKYILKLHCTSHYIGYKEYK